MFCAIYLPANQPVFSCNFCNQIAKKTPIYWKSMSMKIQPRLVQPIMTFQFWIKQCSKIFNYKRDHHVQVIPTETQNLMLSCVLAIKTILFLGSLNNLKCSERIRLVPPGDQTICAGGCRDCHQRFPSNWCVWSLSSLKLILFSERTGTGGGRREEREGRQLGISQARFVLPSPSLPLT